MREAQEYTWQTLNSGFRPGMGQHIPDRFFWAREAEDEDRQLEDDADGEEAREPDHDTAGAV